MMTREKITPPGPMEKIAINGVLNGVQICFSNSIYDVAKVGNSIPGSNMLNNLRDAYSELTINNNINGTRLDDFVIANRTQDDQEILNQIWSYPQTKLSSEQRSVLEKHIGILNQLPNLTQFETEIVSLK